jgi:prophage maintenance system killer protein
VNRELAIQLFKRSLPELVSDACQLEGINFTVPDIQTLLGGMSVGNKSLHEQDIAINQINAWKVILSDLINNKIEINKDYSNKIHKIAAKEDAMEWGQFRSGNVTIAGTEYLPPKTDELDGKYAHMLNEFSNVHGHYNKATFLFLHYAKNQFYFDNNKRQGRFMMNAYLLDQGLPSISIPKKKENEFNNSMVRFYDSSENNTSEMHAFLMGCIHPTIAEQFDLPVINFQEYQDVVLAIARNTSLKM